MGDFEQHCRDCKRLLGDPHEAVHLWIDKAFEKHGPAHRRLLHHTNGVRKAAGMFSRDGVRAVIAHIVRDCGEVPREREYDVPKEGIEIAPAFMAPDNEDREWAGFEKKVREEWKRLLLVDGG